MASEGEAAADVSESRPAPAVSFGFSRTVSRFLPSGTGAGPGATGEGEKEEREYLTGIRENELESTKPSEKPKELIIPLIQKNRWNQKSDRTSSGTGEGKPGEPVQEKDSVESQAVQELIEESRRQLEEWQSGPQADLNLSIPLLLQNKVPDGFEDGDTVRVDLRPESSTEADYESVPVESYGLAMLKGMGWTKEEGIGRTFKQDVKPIEHQLRPKGLGLGADRSAIRDLEPGRKPRPLKPGEERANQEEEELVMGPGGRVLVESGAHKDLYGTVEGVDADNARVVVKLAIGGQTATISQYSVRLVGRLEFNQFSKDLSRLSKAHKEKEKEKEREKEREKEKERTKEREKDRERDKHHSSSKDRKRKHKEKSKERDAPPPKEARPSEAPPPWLQRDLRVRFIDKTFKGGRYYNAKMRVEDVLTPFTCVCRTDEGRLLDDVRQEMLETIVPKNDNDSVMVVLGKHRGQVGRILRRDKSRCVAMVQLERLEEELLSLDYDCVCHYVGEH